MTQKKSHTSAYLIKLIEWNLVTFSLNIGLQRATRSATLLQDGTFLWNNQFLFVKILIFVAI